jgi:hypothetical protein
MALVTRTVGDQIELRLVPRTPAPPDTVTPPPPDYILEGKPAIKKWWSTHSKDRRYWELFGFEKGWIPDWRTTYIRFNELRDMATGPQGDGDESTNVNAFEELAIDLIRAARARDPRVGAWGHMDGTDVEAHVRAHHDCKSWEYCPNGSGEARAPKKLGRTTTENASRHRQEVASRPADATSEGVEADGLVGLRIERRVRDPRGGERIRVGGHWFWVRDSDAGIRTYRSHGTTTKSWIGYLAVITTDHFTGGTLLPMLYRADQNESTVFPEIVKRLCEVLQETPTWLSTDRGPALRANYEVCTRAGIGLVAPYRRENGSSPRTMPEGPKGPHGPLWDNQGRPRCQHCGGPAAHRSFDTAQGKPRLRYECELKPYPECEKEKKISCSKDWRALIPHPRDSDAYITMAISHSPSERTHGALRHRFGILGKSLAGRSHKIGLAWQRIRTAAAWFIEWLWLSRRVGWLDGYEATVGAPERPSDERLKRAREEHRARQDAIRHEEQEAARRRETAATDAAPPG